MKTNKLLIGLVMVSLILQGCLSSESLLHSNERVGLLVEDTIDDQGWNSKGYQGLLNIQSNLNMDVFYKENVSTEKVAMEAVESFVNQDIALIFGHGQFFSDVFMDVKDEYPNVHFVSFNGEVEGDNITSLHFDGYAMGFFAGMLAAKMTEQKTVGVIGAQQWQPEIEGFRDGIDYVDDEVHVLLEYTNDWADEELALQTTRQMVKEGTDIIYPAGDGFHEAVIQEMRERGLYAIGYIGDQSDLGESTVLTSTVQHVDKLYEAVAKMYRNDELTNGNMHVDFMDGVISLGTFSPVVPDEVKKEIKSKVEEYKKTGKLPIHQEDSKKES